MFKRTAIEKSFRSSLIVLFLSELTVAIGPLIDGIVIAAFLGTNGVKEFGIVNPALVVYNVIGSVFAVGSVTLCTRLVGRGKTEEARGAFSVSFFCILGLSVLITAVLLCLSDPVINLLGLAPEAGQLYTEARNYFIGITVSFPAINLVLFLTSYMQVDNDRSRALIATIVLTATDVAGDLLSAMVLHAGMLGMGLATSISYYLALLVLLLHFRKKNAFFKPRFKKLPWSLTGTILKGGAVSCVTLGGSTVLFIILNRILIRYGGGLALVAFTVQRNVYNLASSVPKSVGRDVMTMSGFFHGERNRGSLSELFRMTVKYTILMAGGACILCIALSGVFASIFAGDNPDAIPQSARAVRIAALCLPFLTLNIGYECFFRGAGRMKASVLISVLRDGLLGIVTALILSQIMGEQSVFWVLTVSQMVLLLCIAAVIMLRCRKKDKSFIEMALFLPDGYDVPDEDCIYRSIHEPSECTELSEAVMSLCRQHGMEERRSLAAALATEEMCNNILRHGFKQQKKKLISARILIDHEKKIRISIRDDCAPFSPVEWNRIHNNDEDRISYIGIRMVAAIAEEMRYVNVMDMNSLYITI